MKLSNTLTRQVVAVRSGPPKKTWPAVMDAFVAAESVTVVPAMEAT